MNKEESTMNLFTPRGRSSSEILFVLLLIVLFSISGCSSRAPEYASEPAYDSDSVSNERGAAESPAEAPPAAPSPEQAGSGFDLGDAVESQHKIIYSGEIVMESLEFDETVEEVQSYVNRLGGYAESSYIEGRRITETIQPSRRTASFTFRVPQQRFFSFTEGLKEYGNVLTSSTYGENITERYFDTEARLVSLKIQEERMLSLLERAENIEDILRIESELTNLRYQVESLTGTIQKWDNLVQFATIRVDIREVDKVTPDPDVTTWGTEISDAFKDSVIAVIRTLQNLIIFLIMALPFAVVFLPLALLGVKIYRMIHKKMGKRSETDKK
jgi:hypothetical protein